jgi:hypothetical protein
LWSVHGLYIYESSKIQSDYSTAGQLLKEGTFNKAIRKSLIREIAKRMDESSIRLQGPSIWILWKCRPPPKRKR